MPAKTSSRTYKTALKVAEQLSAMDNETLMEELGLRGQDIHHVGGAKRAMAYQGEYAQDAETLLSTEDLKKFGLGIWHEIEPQLMNFVCNQDDENKKQLLNGKSIPEIAASLATTAIVAAFAPPAWVIVATTIFAKMIAKSALDTLCEEWKGTLAP